MTMHSLWCLMLLSVLMTETAAWAQADVRIPSEWMQANGQGRSESLPVTVPRAGEQAPSEPLPAPSRPLQRSTIPSTSPAIQQQKSPEAPWLIGPRPEPEAVGQGKPEPLPPRDRWCVLGPC